MRIPDPKAVTAEEAYLGYKAEIIEESELKPSLYEPDWHFDGWLAYWCGLTSDYPVKNVGKNLFDADYYKNATYTTGTYEYVETNFAAGETYTFTAQLKPGKTAISGLYVYISTATNPNSAPESQRMAAVYNGSTTTAPSKTSSVPSGATLYFQFYPTTVDITQLFDTYEFQLEKGSSATSYEPYSGEPEMLCDEEAIVAYLSGVTDTYPEEIKDPYDVRITGYLRYLCSYRFGRPEYPVTNSEFYLSLLDAPHTSNETPSADIELDTSEGKLIDVKAYGDTYQQTYSGKNLCDGSNPTTFASATSSLIGNTITISSTTTVTTPYCSWEVPVSEGDIVKVEGIIKESNGRIVRQTYDGSSWGGYIAADYIDGTSVSSLSVTAGSGITKIRINLYSYTSIPSGDTSASYENVIITKNNSDMSYEPYVGGIPSPNPSYPQDIQVVTGEQTVNVHGKNMVNPNTFVKGRTDNGVIDYASGTTSITSTSDSITFVTNQTFRGIVSDIIDVLPNTEYTNQYIADSYSGYISRFVDLYDKDNNWISRATITNNTFTTTANSKYVRVSFIMSTVGTAVLKNIQIEQGPATTYEPYQSQDFTVDLGSTELAKIGDYQDYIYKSSGDWYVHKEVGKTVVTGSESETWTTADSQNTGDTFYASCRNIDSDGPTQTGQDGLISNYFIQTSNIWGGDDVGSQIIPSQSWYKLRFRILKTDLTTVDLAGVKAWFAAHNTTVYYILNTPTNTKITDSTLIGELEALAGADTYDKKTFIKVTATDPNLPALLKVEAYKY